MKKLTRSIFLGLALLLLPGLAWAQQGTLTGTVTEAETGEPLPGATIQVVGEELGTAADSEGSFQISGVPAGNQTIRVSFVGFQDEERAVNIPAGGTTQVRFQLEQQTRRLQEVVKVGFGQKEREKILGSVSTVDAADIEDISSVSTPEELIQGQAGVNVTVSSGLAGQAVNVSVRGASSINSGTSPLYVVDGTPITSGGGTGGGYGQATDPLATIAPSSIASIEVLKGPSATAIYGSRGSNGVVLIQTKEGTAGDTRVSASYQAGAVQSTSDFEEVMVNGPQFLKLHTEAAVNRLGLPNDAAGRQFLRGFFGAEVPANPDTAQTFPWLDKAKQTGVAQTANVSISGGSEDTQYFLGGTFTRDESYVRTNQFNRFSGRLNLSHSVNDWLRAGTNTSVTRTENFQAAADNLVAGVLTSSALMAPTVPIRNDDGSFNFDNPWSIADNVIGSSELSTNTIRNWRVISTSFLEASPLNSLTFRTEFGVDALIVDDFDRDNRKTTDGAPNGAGFTQFEEQRRYTFRGTVNYSNTFADRHDVGLLVGTSIEDQRRDDIEAAASNFASAAFRNVSSGASPTTTSFSVFRKEGIMGFFGRANYTLDNKYIFEGSLRWDASSRFGEDNRWGRFGSLSAGWRIGQEDFLQPVGWLSSLKLRGSAGWTGNNQLNDNFHPAITQAGGGQDYNNLPGVSITSLGNPSLQWETTRSIEGGFDLGLFNERIFLSSTYYRSLTTDLVTETQLPSNSGFTDVVQNRGELFRQGIEVGLETQNLVGEFQWSTNINLTWKENEVESLPGGDPILSGAQRAIEGKELGFFMREYVGVNPDNGKPQWLDAEGNPTTSFGQAEESFQGGILPNFLGGVTNTLRYKGFDLKVTANFETGHKIFNDTKSFLMQFAGFGLHEDALDRWQEPGDQTDVPRATLFDLDDATNESTRFLKDADWLRISNVTFGYTLPQEFTGEFGVNSLRLFFQASNVVTFDNLSIGDPEGVAFGADNVLNRGELFFTPPPQRTFTGGVRLQL
jgi:TonB-linked SusC/RagA family outer membrane protein